MNHPLHEQVFTHAPRKQLITSIWIIPVAVLLIVGATLSRVTYDEYHQAQESEYRLLEAHARYADVQIASALSNISHLLANVANERLANPPLRNHAFEATLTRHLRDLPEIGTLLVTDARGRVEFSTKSSIKGYDASKQAYFTEHFDRAQQSKLFISRPDKTLLGVTAVTLTLPIVDAGHHFAGVVGVTVDYNYFAGALRSVNPEDSASVTVVINQYGDLVYRRLDPEKYFGFNAIKISKVFQEHLRAGTQVTRHIGPSYQNGKTRLFLIRRINDTGLNLILSRQQDEVLAEWRRNLVTHTLIFVFTTAVMLFLAWVAQRRQSQLLAAAVALRSAKEAAEVANSAKSHFLAAASHDLRQPLHALALLVSVLKHRHGNESSMKIIKPIEASIQALKELLDALLDISKLDAGIVIPKKQAVSIDALMGRLESEFRMQIEAKHLKFRIRRSQKNVRTDPTLLMVMLRNLLSNAYHHTKQGGILLGCRSHLDHLLIQVWDTGKGIPVEEQGRIFQEYYQVDNPERDRHKGLGLGLSIVDRIAKLLGHRITVRSRIGKGSMFEIAVPLAREAPSLPRKSTDAIAPVSPVNILIIDDDPIVSQSTVMLLESLGYHAIAAESAEDALLKIRGHLPDVILADYRLRNSQTGIDAIATIRASLEISVPGILVTGDTLPERLREANASGYPLLHKPVDPDELNAHIKRLLVKSS